MRSLKTKLALISLIILLIGIWLPTFYASQMLHDDMQHLLGEQQFSAVSITAAQVNQEFDDRLKALKKVAGHITPEMISNPAVIQKFLEDRLVLQTLFNGGAIITSADGVATASVPRSSGRTGVSYMDRDFIVHALKDGKATIGKPVMGKKLLAPLISIGVPIHDAQGKVTGALAGVINLSMPNFLDKVTETTQSTNGGYLLLVAPQHRLVVAATEKSRIMERVPDPGVIPAIDRFTQGFEGSAVYVNPLGVEVLSSAKGIPVAGWLVVISTPTDEAFAPVHAMQRRVLLASILLSLLTGGLVWGMTSWVVRRRLSPMIAATATLSTQAESNQRPQPLPIGNQDEIGELIGSFNRLVETLAYREAALNDAQRIAKVGSWSLDLIGGKLTWSDEIFRLFEMDPQQFSATYEAFLNAIHPEDRDEVNAAYTDSLATRTPYEITHRLLMKDGSIKWVHERCVSEFDESGKPLRSTGTVQDITERKLLDVARIASHERLLTVLNGLDAIVYVADMNTHEVLFVNNFVKDVFGDIVGQRCWQTLQTGQSGPCAFCTNNKLLDGAGNPAGIYHWELQNTVNGHWYDIRDRAIAWTDGRIVRLEIATDITEKRQAEESLRKSAEKYRELVQRVHVAVVIHGPDTRISDCNPLAQELLGLTEDQLLGKDAIDPAWHFRREDGTAMGVDEYPVNQVIARREPVRNLVVEVHRPGGKQDSDVWVLVNADPVFGSDAELLQVIVTFTDITERKQAEAVVQRERRMLYSILEGLPGFVYLQAPDYSIKFANRYFQEHFGSPNQVPCYEVISGRSEPCETCPTFRVFDTQKPQIWEASRVRDGKTYMIHDYPFIDEDGQHLVLELGIDITERKQAEKELKRSNAELEQFSYAVSHDMRQPLRMISGHLSLLEKNLADRLDAEQRQSFRFAIDGAKRMDAMMVGLLEYSRVGRKGEPPALVESRALLDDALLFLQPAIVEAHANVSIQGEWPRIVVSPDELLRLMQNLIANALKFRVAGRTPEVSVTSEIAGNEWRVCVSDNGVGIFPDQIGRLFQVFQRLQSRTAYEGSGIGLALCRKIVERHNGRIWVESAGVNEGCAFMFTLPIAADA